MSASSFQCRRVVFMGVYYRLSWSTDHYMRNSMLRFPRRHTRDTDYAGAVRFCKRHDLPAPAPEMESPK